MSEKSQKASSSLPSKVSEKEKSYRVYRRLLCYLYPYRRRFFLALGAMVVYGATDGAVPYLLKRILDDVFGSGNTDMLKLLVWVIVIFAMIRGVFGFLQKYLAATVGLGIVQDLRNAINRKLLELSPGFFHHHSTGNLIARVTNDTLLVRTALTDSAAALLRDAVRVIALLSVAIYLDPVLAAIAFIGFPLGLIPVLRFGRKVRRLSRVGQDHFGGLTGLLQEMIVGHNVVQAFTKEDYEYDRFASENRKFTNIFRRAEKYGALSGPTNEVIASMAIALVIFYGGFSVISGVRTQGDFIAFITSIFLLYEPLKKLSRINNVIQTGVASAERIFEVLDLTPEVRDMPNALDLKVSKPRIEFRDVCFRYAKGESLISGTLVATRQTAAEEELSPWALRDVSLAIEPGETVALVGMSGGGKSTLVNLLPRFYDPQQGKILIDGTDIRQASLHSLRQSIAIVNQHTFLFNDTVYRNIAYGKEQVSEEEVWQAAQAANAHTFIAAMPEGYQTVIGEQGLKLSGGERARIAIARALLRNAPILILDEATASLDSESEGLVQEAIDHLMEGRTVLVIAHRLATVRKANKIAVIVKGQIVELGAHDVLLEKNGEYAKLHKLQFRLEEAQPHVVAL